MSLSADLLAVEWTNAASGYAFLSEALKTENVEHVQSAPSGLGRFFTLLKGSVSGLKESFKIIQKSEAGSVLDARMISLVPDSVLAGYLHLTKVQAKGAVAVLEAKTIPCAIEAATVASQLGGVELMDIMNGRQTGGHTVIFLTGSPKELETAVDRVRHLFRAQSEFLKAIVVQEPAPRFLEFFSLS